MQLREIPGCCTAKVIIDLGESKDSEFGFTTYTEAQIKEYVHKQLSSYYFKDKAMFTVFITKEQKRATKVLKEMGFQHSKWMKSKEHNWPIRVYFISIQEYLSRKGAVYPRQFKEGDVVTIIINTDWYKARDVGVITRDGSKGSYKVDFSGNENNSTECSWFVQDSQMELLNKED